MGIYINRTLCPFFSLPVIFNVLWFCGGRLSWWDAWLGNFGLIFGLGWWDAGCGISGLGWWNDWFDILGFGWWNAWVGILSFDLRFFRRLWRLGENFGWSSLNRRSAVEYLSVSLVWKSSEKFSISGSPVVFDAPTSVRRISFSLFYVVINYQIIRLLSMA